MTAPEGLRERIAEALGESDALYEVESVIHQHCGSDGSSDEHNDWVHDLANLVVPFVADAVLDALGLEQVGWWLTNDTPGHECNHSDQDWCMNEHERVPVFVLRKGPE